VTLTVLFTDFNHVILVDTLVFELFTLYH